jgi:hypothetical protein
VASTWSAMHASSEMVGPSSLCAQSAAAPLWLNLAAAGAPLFDPAASEMKPSVTASACTLCCCG